MAKLTVYTTATCGFCHMLKTYLQGHDVAFEEKKADTDPQLAQELYEKSGQMAVPFTVVETDEGKTETVLGFDKPRFDRLLGLAK